MVVFVVEYAISNSTRLAKDLRGVAAAVNPSPK
jgi:hypothetical protein